MWRVRIYTVLSVTAFGVLYAFTALVVLLALPPAFMKWRSAVRFLIRLWARNVFRIIGKKLHVEGLEKIKKDGRYILVANHASLFDIMAIMAFYPGVSWFGHERLLKIPVFSQILRMTDYVPMRKASVGSTKTMIDQLIYKSRGHTVAMFPEGTRTLTGEINGFYRGFVHLLRASEISLLPVTLNGFYDLKPKNRFYIDFGSRIDVVIHDPIERDILISRSDAEIIEYVKSIMESGLTGRNENAAKKTSVAV
jgi:1-acyl-sn-glycerol-3-phosphate acyltransferase